jgi:hypothetical protein
MKFYENLEPDLSEHIKTLCRKHDLSLWNKLRKEADKTVFYSLLIEAHYGLFYDKTCLQLKYNHKAFRDSDLTPDFVITQNGQDIIVDVCRINPAKEDQEIHEAQTVWTNSSITIKPEKLYGNKGALVNKAEKYGTFVATENKPFLICLYFDFVSGHDALDLYHCLYGHSAEFGGDIGYGEYTVGTTFYYLVDALYYSNEQMKKNVSGVLLRTNKNEFIYFHNFYFGNRLNYENVA